MSASPPVPLPPRTRPLRPENIRLGLVAKLIINIFTPCDGINALTDRRWFRDAPYAYASYLHRAGAKTFPDKMRVIWAAKQEKAKKLIMARRRYGRIPEPYRKVCRKTPCGLLRLLAAYLS
ncbi:MAG: hypothetical protein LDL11_04300 [Desulfarculus sp.]|nr:hypothetical protein [Desulfarculus sp.]